MHDLIASSLVVFAILTWAFDGSLRQWAVALLFPKKWMGNSPRSEIAWASGTKFEDWLCLYSPCPEFLRKLLLCPFCSAFHVSYLWGGAYFSLLAFCPAVASVVTHILAAAGGGMLLLKLGRKH